MFGLTFGNDHNFQGVPVDLDTGSGIICGIQVNRLQPGIIFPLARGQWSSSQTSICGGLGSTVRVRASSAGLPGYPEQDGRPCLADHSAGRLPVISPDCLEDGECP